jgi:hypothetical protein
MNPARQNFAQLSKWADRNRFEFLQTEVQSTWALIRLAKTERQIGNEEQAERSLQHAEQGYAVMVRFLDDPKHTNHMSAEDYRRLRAETSKLRRALDEFTQRT